MRWHMQMRDAANIRRWRRDEKEGSAGSQFPGNLQINNSDRIDQMKMDGVVARPFFTYSPYFNKQAISLCETF
jgi:hypothetical protein